MYSPIWHGIEQSYFETSVQKGLERDGLIKVLVDVQLVGEATGVTEKHRSLDYLGTWTWTWTK